jgi:hypothetical protein
VSGKRVLPELGRQVSGLVGTFLGIQPRTLRVSSRLLIRSSRTT